MVEALHELYAPNDAQTHDYYDIATAEWASDGRWKICGSPDLQGRD